MSEQIGVKETKELVVGLLKILTVMVKQFKDGAQASDAAELYENIVKNPEVKAAIMAAYEGYDKVPEEVKDTSVIEFAQLVGASIPELIKLAEEIKS